MPHFVIEYSRRIEDTVDMNEIMEAVFSAACQSGLMQPDDIKIRAIPFDHFKLSKKGETFMHLTVSLLEGRSDENKEALAILVREKLSNELKDVNSISIDVRDMNAVAYKKRVHSYLS